MNSTIKLKPFVNCFKLNNNNIINNNKTKQLLSLQSIRYLSGSSPKKTCLYDFHVENGGKIVNFAGFQMPVLYNNLSINDSHLHTRQSSSLFDVSHMLQMQFTGKDCIDFMERLTVADIDGLQVNTGTLTLYTNDKGGINDDLIVSKTANDSLYIVSNAGRIEQDLKHVMENCQLYKSNNKDVDVQVLNRALLALQGPQSATCLQPLVGDYDLAKLNFMTSVVTSVCGIEDCRITRCGYTGEDGFEISVPTEKAVYVCKTLLSASKGAIKLAGLGARDTLRLEAGLCLYGNDINETTGPVEGSLTWTIAKRRRNDANFIGADIILKQLKVKPKSRRVGLMGLTSGPPARSHVQVLDVTSKQPIGEVTSGCPSPSLKKNIAMAYLPFSHKLGTNVLCDIRGKQFEYEIVKMPFVATKYYFIK
ncbi:aminomethyltransferase, mitochondrial-like [Oppia nitens]|uniref:aminomethyltransferase, mitochondrial-like n=1 Tax=Oppia nitens TaxID=1686743 RepID=UPI0023DC15C6|nr:aminomethyltransferase, mitochondrial-like [Oppia nitens]